jgi:hypothetical protein
MAVTIESIGNLLSACNEATKKFESVIWWRGVEKSNYSLQPGIYRRPDFLHEKDILNTWRYKAPWRRSDCPAPDDFQNWLFLMQHYRLPTRLLDWTESPLTAAFFAVRKRELHLESGALWALGPIALNVKQFGGSARGIFLPREPKIKSLFDNAFFPKEENKLEKIAAICPPEIDIRLMVQMSVFTIHGTSTPLEQIEGNENFLMKFEISAQGKKNLLNQLKLLGISERNLFPDLDHLSEDIASEEFTKY